MVVEVTKTVSAVYKKYSQTDSHSCKPERWNMSQREIMLHFF